MPATTRRAACITGRGGNRLERDDLVVLFDGIYQLEVALGVLEHDQLRISFAGLRHLSQSREAGRGPCVRRRLRAAECLR